MKDNESITIDPNINKEVKKQAKKEDRSFSGMMQHMAKKYLSGVGIKFID